MKYIDPVRDAAAYYGNEHETVTRFEYFQESHCKCCQCVSLAEYKVDETLYCRKHFKEEFETEDDVFEVDGVEVDDFDYRYTNDDMWKDFYKWEERTM